MTELIVRAGGHTEIATVEKTVETNSTTYARVQGEYLGGWVEVSDTPATPKHALLCTDCGHIEEIDGTPTLVDDKENICNSEGSAELLRKIHEIKNPDHNPRVERRAA